MITERTAAFQGLRLIGIITIVAGHVGLNWVGGGNWCTFFFLLSGFLYKTSIENWKDYGLYLKRKTERLYPIYWFCLALYMLLALIRGCKEQYAIDWNFIPHIFLLQSWIPNVQPQAYLGPAWFISSLLFCYCASPIAKKIADKGIWAVAVIIGLMYLWNIVGFEHYISPIYRFLEYSIGVWMHRWICNNDQQKEPFYGFSPFAIVVILVILHFGVNYWTNILLFIGLIYIVYMFSSPSLKKILGNRFILQLAKSDIFIYLTHPGIGFHLVFFFICYNPVVATIGSVMVGYALCFIYKQSIGKIIQAR